MATSSTRTAPKFLADESLLTGYELALRSVGRKEKTLETYRESLKMLSRFLAQRSMPGLAGASTEHLREFFNSLYERGNKPATVSVRYRALRKFYRWMLAEGERPDNPMERVQPPRIPDQIMPHYTEAELHKVLRLLPPTSRDVGVLRDRALLLTLLDSGLRASELCGLRVEDLDLRHLSITVRAAKSDKERLVGVGGTTAQAIDRMLRRRQGFCPWLFASRTGRQLSYGAVRQMIQRLFERAGVPFRGVHAFRRSWASAFLDAGGSPTDLQALAGWSSPAMVRRYTRGTESARALKAHRQYSPVDRMGLGR